MRDPVCVAAVDVQADRMSVSIDGAPPVEFARVLSADEYLRRPAVQAAVAQACAEAEAAARALLAEPAPTGWRAWLEWLRGFALRLLRRFLGAVPREGSRSKGAL